MRILVTTDPYIPVPPIGYGGIERVVDILVRGLTLRGHELILVAHPDSHTRATLVPYGRPPHVGTLLRTVELWQVGSAVWRRRHAVQLVHSFGRLAALLPILPLRALPKIQSYQREIPWRSIGRAAALAGPSIVFTGCAPGMYANKPANGAGEWTTIPNPVETSSYDCRVSVASDAPLMFLGRLEAIKGAHNAIAIARGANRRLIIAGNRMSEGSHARYFEEYIAPYVDGSQIVYVGEVNDVQKNDLLGRAAALLMPIEWDEPFGIVMAEALACGTPIIAFKRGSVPYIVRDGVNGFICTTAEGAIQAVGRLHEIDRSAVRADCEARFDSAVIVSRYEQLYEHMLGRAA